MESDGRSCSSCVEGAAIENKLGGVPFITGLVSNPIFFLIIISFLDLISFPIYCLSFSPFFKPRFLSSFVLFTIFCNFLPITNPPLLSYSNNLHLLIPSLLLPIFLSLPPFPFRPLALPAVWCPSLPSSTTTFLAGRCAHPLIMSAQQGPDAQRY